MAENILRKSYNETLGLDLKSSDLNRPEGHASGIKNIQFRKSGAKEKRKGYQAASESCGGFGTFTYSRVNPVTSADEAEILRVGSTVYKEVESTLTVTYTGLSATAILSIYFNPTNDEYECQIQVGTAIVLTQGLGKGFDELSTYTVDDLKTAIDALTDITATLTGSTTTPAAFIPIVRNADLTIAPYVAKAKYCQEINTPITNPLSGSETNKNSLDFENVSSVQLNNNIYFSNGYDEVLKYDGQNLYRAGLPTPTVSSALGGAGAVTGTNYYHVAQYVQIDNSLNVVEGNTQIVTAGLSPSAQSMNVTVSNIQASTGFNTNCAIVAGAQVTVNTITVDNGSGGAHTMKVGDTAYFYDAVSAAYIEREVTAVAGTTITVAGAAVTVADNAVISNNLRIAIWRNETSAITPDTFFLVEEIPNNSFAATQVYNDNKLDTALGAQLLDPITDRSPPPKGKYISAFKNQMIIAGQIGNPNNVSYSTPENPEYFPADANAFLVETVTGDIITGIAPNNELFAIFKSKSIFMVTGNIAEDQIRVDLLSQDIGCAAHASIAEVRGALCFLSDRGPYALTGGQIPTQLGDGKIDPAFDGQAMNNDVRILLFGTQVLTPDQQFVLKRSVGINDRTSEKYLLYVPCLSTEGSDKYENSNSKIFAFEYERNGWLLWDNINAAGGMAIFGDDVYWTERRYSSFNTSVDSILYRRHNINDAWDYEDHDSPVDVDYSTNWESLGEPSVLKRFTRFKFYNFEETPNNEFNLTVKVETNYIHETTVGEFTLTGASGGYGVSAYGTSAYGDPTDPTMKHKLNPGRVKSMRLRFQNSEHHQNIIIPGWELECVAPFKPAFKS